MVKDDLLIFVVYDHYEELTDKCVYYISACAFICVWQCVQNLQQYKVFFFFLLLERKRYLKQINGINVNVKMDLL